MVQACDLSNWEVGGRGSEVWGRPQLHNGTLKGGRQTERLTENTGIALLSVSHSFTVTFVGSS